MSIIARRMMKSATQSGLFFRKDMQAFFPDKRVWAHYAGNGLSYYSADNLYGANFPLNLVGGQSPAPDQPAKLVRRALEAGVTGIEILEGSINSGTDHVTGWAAGADPTWSDPDPAKRVQIALCVADDPSSILRLVRNYVTYDRAGNHPSIAKIEGNYLIFAYGSRETGKTPSDWASIRSTLASENIPVVFVGDLDNLNPQPSFPIDASVVAPYFPYFEASYCFDWGSRDYPTPSYQWDTLFSVMNTYQQPYAGGVTPGYDREYPSGGSYLDARGTRYFRSQFEQYRNANMRWQTLVTWNDIAEHTNVEASSEWNRTRADISAFYSAILRNVAFPRPQAELYVTTPQAIFVGQPFGAEAMTLNAGGLVVKTTIQLLNEQGVTVSSVYTSPEVLGGHSGDATMPDSFAATTAHAGHWYRAEAVLYDDNNQELQRVTSAPIVVYAQGAVPSSRMYSGSTFRRMYYSIPAYNALSEVPNLSIPGSPTNGQTTATVTLPSNAQMYTVDVLQNTRQVKVGFNTNSYTVPVPMPAHNIAGGLPTDAAANGYYVGRVIDVNDRVGYSNPRFYS